MEIRQAWQGRGRGGRIRNLKATGEGEARRYKYTKTDMGDAQVGG